MIFLLTNNHKKTSFLSFSLSLFSSPSPLTSALLSSSLLLSPCCLSSSVFSVLPWGGTQLPISIYFSLAAHLLSRLFFLLLLRPNLPVCSVLVLLTGIGPVSSSAPSCLTLMCDPHVSPSLLLLCCVCRLSVSQLPFVKSALRVSRESFFYRSAKPIWNPFKNHSAGLMEWLMCCSWARGQQP